MKKISIALLIFVFILTSCNTEKSAIKLTEPTETLMPSPTTFQSPTASATFTVTPTITPSPTPSANYKMVGLNFGPFTQLGQNPNLGTIIQSEQFEKQIALIAPYTQWIRTYGCSGFEPVISIAHNHGLKVAFGAWLGKDEAANDKEIACLVKASIEYQPEIIIVGSETLHRGDLTAAQLIDTLQTVKKVLPNFVVTTADTAASWMKNKSLVEVTDVVFANIYPYWEGVEVSKSIASLNTTFSQLQQLSGDKEVWVSETGWPDSGNILKEAIPSPENSAAYFINFISWAKAKNVNYFYFEAFDEPWKKTEENPQEAHWGIWTSDYIIKNNMSQVFDGNSVPDNWTPTETPVPTLAPTKNPILATPKPTEALSQGSPSISISLPTGSSWPANGVLRGYTRNVDPAKYKVAVYINVDGGWWTKPYFDYPLINIAANGYWETTFITGGNDANASEIIAVLIPSGTSVQLANGGGLPDIGSFQTARISR